MSYEQARKECKSQGLRLAHLNKYNIREASDFLREAGYQSSWIGSFNECRYKTSYDGETKVFPVLKTAEECKGFNKVVFLPCTLEKCELHVAMCEVPNKEKCPKENKKCKEYFEVSSSSSSSDSTIVIKKKAPHRRHLIVQKESSSSSASASSETKRHHKRAAKNQGLKKKQVKRVVKKPKKKTHHKKIYYPSSRSSDSYTSSTSSCSSSSSYHKVIKYTDTWTTSSTEEEIVIRKPVKRIHKKHKKPCPPSSSSSSSYSSSTYWKTKKIIRPRKIRHHKKHVKIEESVSSCTEKSIEENKKTKIPCKKPKVCKKPVKPTCNQKYKKHHKRAYHHGKYNIEKKIHNAPIYKHKKPYLIASTWSSDSSCSFSNDHHKKKYHYVNPKIIKPQVVDKHFKIIKIVEYSTPYKVKVPIKKHHKREKYIIKKDSCSSSDSYNENIYVTKRKPYRKHY